MVEANRMRVLVLFFGICFGILFAIEELSFASEEPESLGYNRYFLRKDYLNFKPESACAYFFDSNALRASACTSLFLSGSMRISSVSEDAQLDDLHANVSDSMYYGLFPMVKHAISEKALVLIVYFANGQAVYSPPISLINAENIIESTAMDSLAKTMIKIERERLDVMDQTRQEEYGMAEFMARISTYKEGSRLLQLNKEKTELLRQISELEYNQERFTELISSSRRKDSPIQQSNQLRKRDLAIAVKQVVENSVRSVSTAAR